jgi:hypothetical protein
LLAGFLAVETDRKRDLIAGPTLIAWASEHGSGHQEQRCVIVERRAGIAAQFGHGFAKCREDIAGDLEAQNMTLDSLFSGVAGATSAGMP